MCRTQATARRSGIRGAPERHPTGSALGRQLGDNLNRRDVAPNNVVLLVRGELFRRYPNAIVYAVKAKQDRKRKRIRDDVDQRYPIFRGTLPGDITFLGFNLGIADARGGTTASPDGFFFVFQQPPAEPRFGLEPMGTQVLLRVGRKLSWPVCQYSGRHRPQGSLDAGKHQETGW